MDKKISNFQNVTKLKAEGLIILKIPTKNLLACNRCKTLLNSQDCQTWHLQRYSLHPSQIASPENVHV